MIGQESWALVLAHGSEILTSPIADRRFESISPTGSLLAHRLISRGKKTVNGTREYLGSRDPKSFQGLAPEPATRCAVSARIRLFPLMRLALYYSEAWPLKQIASTS